MMEADGVPPHPIRDVSSEETSTTSHAFGFGVVGPPLRSERIYQVKAAIASPGHNQAAAQDQSTDLRPILTLRSYSPDGSLVVYSGPDIGTTFRLQTTTADGSPHHPLPNVVLTRGARHLTFLPGGDELVILRGEIQHKNLWLLDVETGAERQMSDVGPDFDIRDFDVSPDGREFVLERVQEHSNIVLVERAQQ
jgi:hypothetical protein